MATKKAKGHGGRRKGAGRPSIIDEPVKLSLTLEQTTLDGLVGLAAREDLPLAVYVRRTLAQHVARRQRTRRGH